MTDISCDLPNRLIDTGVKLFMRDDGEITKYVLENPKINYRSFIHIKNGRESALIKDLFNKYYFDNGIGVVASK